MPNYLQASELGKYFPEGRIIDLAGGDRETETLSALEPATQTTLDDRIVNAEAEADAYLQGRFPLPISPVPERLKLAIGKMAVYYLFEDRPELWGGADRNPKQREYDAQIEWLEGVKELEMFVGSTELPTPNDILTTADGDGGGLVFGNGGLSEF